jgi:cytochrome c oxidase accessory protein FixG
VSEAPQSPKVESQATEIRYVNLYDADEKVYIRRITGFYQRLRRYISFPLILGFMLIPWIVIDRRPAMLFDLSTRQFHILWLTFSPQDGFYLAWLLIIAAFSLFTVTAVVGRVWCGFTCPQTVWTQIYMWAELLCEGDRNKRIKLDSQNFSVEKLTRKTAKHSIWLLVALATSISFVGYFVPVRELMASVFTLSAKPVVAFWVLLFTGATYMNAGFLREQVCKYMCPYARFQSVMYDHDTLTVLYDKQRGENRGPRKIDDDYKTQGLGDCIDCSWCVQVCPVNIDIRDGLQAECIDCGLCIDACDSVMEKMNYPLGLISYTTEANAGKSNVKWFRPRVLAYGFVLLVIMGLFGYSISHRVPLIFEVQRDRGAQMYRVVGHDIQNVYTITIENMDRKPHVYDVSVEGDFAFEIQGYKSPLLAEGEILKVPVRVSVKRSELKGETNTININLVARDDSSIKALHSTTFIGPVR